MKTFYIDDLLRALSDRPDCGLKETCIRLGIEPNALARQMRADSQLNAIIMAALRRRKDDA